MKRYLGFFGSVYYPSGGMKDFAGSLDSLPDSIALLENHARKEYPDEPWRFQWAHIYDMEARRVIWADGKEIPEGMMP